MRGFFLSLVFLPLALLAQDFGLPNNTGTKLMSQNTQDGVIKVLMAHVHTHPFGQDLVLKVELHGLGFEKEIWVRDVARQQTQKLSFVSGDMDFRDLGSRALWLGNPAPGVENVLLKIADVSVVSEDGRRVEPHSFSIYIKSQGTQFENRDIRVYR